MTKYRIAAAIALALAGAAGVYSAIAIASDSAPTAAAASAASATHDYQKLSEQGSEAFREVEIARLAIFNGHPDIAMQLIKQAQAALIKTQTDGTAFDKAEADLKSPPGHANPAPVENAGTIRWLPIGADLSIDKDYKADPAKVAAVAKANDNLKSGERDQAIETLRLADVNLTYTLGVVPVKSFVTDVDQAANLLGAGKYYEANLSLKQVQDSVRYDWVEFNAKPVAANSSHTGNASK
jgi:hypothetical protein